MTTPEPNTQRDWHALDPVAVLRRLDVRSAGLPGALAAQRLAEQGPNRLPERKGQGPLARFLKQFHNVLIYILLGAALVTALLQHWLDTGVIFGVVVINAIIGFIQEGKAEKALDAIRGMLSLDARVLRDGAEITVPADKLVVGDVVLLRAGEKIPADLRLLQVRDLQVEEAILTGESVASHKHIEPVSPDALLGDRSCLAFSGTLVTFGTGRGVVVATGAHTEIGRINDMLGNVQQITTPLLRQMAHFSHLLSYVVLGIATLAFFYGWLFTSHGPGEMFLAAVSLAIAAIPEGLPAIMTITLAIGVRRMAQRHAIIRQLPAVDTLGSVTVICSDKTGTLTRNEMTVTTLALADGDVAVSGVGYAPTGGFSRDERPLAPADAPGVNDLLATAVFCTDSHLRQENDQYRLEGAPTDGAMLVGAMKAGLDRDELRRRHPEIDHIPFSSEHKYSARLVRRPEGGARIAVLGAPDQLLKRCTCAQHADGPRPLDAAAWQRRLESLAAQGLRMLGVARKDLESAPERLTAEDVDSDLVLLGLAGIIDPPRDEAIAATAECQSAGIRVIMITGDHKLTAQAIAGQIGIANATVRTGGELEQATDDQLREWVTETSVYARVSPEHKLRLVTALQSHGAVVAMTGDGVNDAPAIKRADVGVGMGVTGTEVTKEAADMVLTDDNFASITSAVREGRTVYDNLRKSVLFILPTNGGEALTLLAAIALGSSLPLTAPQILWVNMVTAVTLALALAFEPPEEDIMRRPPRPTDAAILDRYFLGRIAFVSLLVGLGTFAMFRLARTWGYPLEHAQTLAVNTLVAFEVFYLFNTRFIVAPTLSFSGLFGSRPVLVAVGLVALAQLAYTYLPLMQYLFGSAGLDAGDWLLCVVPGAALLLLVELEKATTRARRSAAATHSGKAG